MSLKTSNEVRNNDISETSWCLFYKNDGAFVSLFYLTIINFCDIKKMFWRCNNDFQRMSNEKNSLGKPSSDKPIFRSGN